MNRKKYLIIFLVIFGVFSLIGNTKATEIVYLEPNDWVLEKFYVGEGDIINGSIYTYNEPFSVYVSWFYVDGDSDFFECLSGDCSFQIWIYGDSGEFEIRLRNSDDVSGYLSYNIVKIGDNYNPEKTDTNLISVIIIVTIVIIIGLIAVVGLTLYYKKKRNTVSITSNTTNINNIPTKNEIIMDNLKFCHSCGAKIKKSSSYCEFCGESQ